LRRIEACTKTKRRGIIRFNEINTGAGRRRRRGQDSVCSIMGEGQYRLQDEGGTGRKTERK